MTMTSLPTGASVALNIQRARTRMGWNFADLSRALAHAGHPLAIMTLQRIERGDRRIDVDDLTAFAAVLGVQVVDLLKPRNCEDDLLDHLAREKKQLTGVPPLTENEAWAWLSGTLTDLSREGRWHWTHAELDALEHRQEGLEDELANANTRTPEGYALLGDSIGLDKEIDYLSRRVEQLTPPTTIADDTSGTSPSPTRD